MKILFITPHLSTGGAPQYLLKKINELNSDNDVYCVEYTDVGGTEFIVQKTKIQNILKDKLYTLYENKNELLNIINKIDPEIVHFEELPEYFCDIELANQIYSNDRKYKIIETSHDSSFDVKNKMFFPDKFIFVSEFQKSLFSELNIDSTVIEYPIEYKEKRSRERCLQELGLDPNKFHILNVGLFTPRKNQLEIVEYAKHLINKNVQFHFVGNQAVNFKEYWEPIMKEFPVNCKWWGERSDVDTFYEAMDLFLFTSRGTNNDKETNPLVLREAIGWKMPVLMYDLEVYGKMHHKYENVHFLKTDNLSFNLKQLESHIDNDVIKRKEKFVFVVSSYPKTSAQIKTTIQCLNTLKMHNIDIILTTHCEIPDSITELCDYVIYDKQNVFTDHTFIDTAWYDYPDFKCSFNFKNDPLYKYHGPAVQMNYYNGISFANVKGYENAICLNYDLLVDDNEELLKILELTTNKLGFFHKSVSDSNEGEIFHTTFFVVNTDLYLNKFPNIKTEKDYTQLCDEMSSACSLEKLYMNIFQDAQCDLYIEHDDFTKYFKNFYNISHNMCEYFTILPLYQDPSKFVIWYSSSNNNDNRKLKLYINDEIITHDINGVTLIYEIIPIANIELPMQVKLEIIDCDTNNILNTHIKNITNEYLKTEIQKNGYFNFFKNKTLTEIANSCFTDKGTSFAECHGYTELYSEWISSTDSLNLLEIGVDRGSSLKMWNKYNSNLNIYGIESEQHRITDLYNHEFNKIFIGNASDTNFLQSVVNQTGKLDIIIDDASHIKSDILTSFKFLYSYLNEGGIYIIEDLHAPEAEFHSLISELNDFFNKSGFTVNYTLHSNNKLLKINK